MADKELAWYVLFNNHTQGLLLDGLLRAAGLRATIVPTPWALSKSCGIALALSADEVEAARALIQREGAEILAIASLEQDIDPLRDRYC
ncbi:MAG: DUF3343 domain-containing protein [Peptococcaceae bacterium]|jgi:hypothetical protein|nr:DUF3343 domain-containing protein [Peptococcaceae bacterium]